MFERHVWRPCCELITQHAGHLRCFRRFPVTAYLGSLRRKARLTLVVADDNFQSPSPLHRGLISSGSSLDRLDEWLLWSGRLLISNHRTGVKHRVLSCHWVDRTPGWVRVRHDRRVEKRATVLEWSIAGRQLRARSAPTMHSETQITRGLVDTAPGGGLVSRINLAELQQAWESSILEVVIRDLAGAL